MTGSGYEDGQRVSRRNALKALGGLGVAGLAGLAGCSEDGGDGTPEGDGADGDTPAEGGESGGETLEAAWVYISEVGDLGWSYAHNEGRKATDESLDWVETTYSEAVDPSDGERVIREYAEQGYDVVFGTTFEYMDPMYNLAEEYEDTIFMHCSGYRTRENMGRYFGRAYQARYLTGIAAGMVTETDTLGYVAAIPTPEVIRGVNAFAAGAASVNDAVTTKVRWTNSWHDPTAEKEAAQALIDEDADVMAQHQDSPSALQAAAEADIWASGYNAPMGEFAEENYLTSPIWHWETYYEPTLEAIRDGTWESDFYWGGLSDGVIDLDEWGPEVPEDVKTEVADAREAIEAGDLDVWADTTFADEDETFLFEEMNSYVDAVEGEVPSDE